ncbi:MAG: SEL1-like repeat protein [Elusimicrobiota bacterium]|nr:SEL1-like repeat protein [Elusimicrobiota bacterium]
MGVMYEDGQGVKRDYQEAAKWYQKAANQGEEYAKKNLERLEDEKDLYKLRKELADAGISDFAANATIETAKYQADLIFSDKKKRDKWIINYVRKAIKELEKAQK